MGVKTSVLPASTAARNLIRASVPERVAMLLPGHKSRTIFDRDNIIHEQELLDAGPTLGDLSDAYLQDYQVRQFRSQSTARGRIAHLVTCFGRDARAAALTTYQIRQYQLARRAAGAATGTINRETSALHRMCTLAVHWGWLDTVPGFPDRLRENPLWCNKAAEVGESAKQGRCEWLLPQ